MTDRFSASIEATLGTLSSLERDYMSRYASEGFEESYLARWGSCYEDMKDILLACGGLDLDLDPVELQGTLSRKHSLCKSAAEVSAPQERSLRASIRDCLQAMLTYKVGSRTLLETLNGVYRKSRIREKLAKEESDEERLFLAGGDAEDYFYITPNNKEVEQLAKSDQKSNLTKTEQAKGAPPTPVDIKEKPGGDTLSTLNRFLLDSDEDDLKRVRKPGPREKPKD